MRASAPTQCVSPSHPIQPLKGDYTKQVKNHWVAPVRLCFFANAPVLQHQTQHPFSCILWVDNAEQTHPHIMPCGFALDNLSAHEHPAQSQYRISERGLYP